MGLRPLRAVTALAGAAVLVVALGACGGGDDGGGGGAGKTLNVLIGANTQYPREQQEWQQSVGDKFKAQTATAYSTGAFVTLGDEEWRKVGGKDKFVPSALGISGPDDRNQVGIPWVGRPFVMVYNTELLRAAGIAEPATTWDELTRQAKLLTRGDQYGLAVAYKDNFDP